MKKIFLITMFAILLVIPFISATTQIVNTTLTATEDTYFVQELPTNNYDSETSLYLLGAAGASRYSFLKYDLSLVQGEIISAYLALMPSNTPTASPAGYSHHLYNQTWSASQIIYNNWTSFTPYNSTYTQNVTEFTTGVLAVWNVTDIAKISKLNGESNMSIILTSTGGAEGGYATFNNTQTYLNITYIPQLLTTLISPANATITGSHQISFNCTSESVIGALNLTLILNGQDNYTIYNTSVGENLTLEHNINLSAGNYNWTCKSANNIGTSTTETRIFTINPIILAICNSTYNVPYFNITSIKDEETLQDIANISMKSSWEIYVYSGGEKRSYNYSFDTINNSFAFCVSPSNTEIFANAMFEYNAINTTAYFTRNYYLTDATLTNSTQNVTFYLANLTEENIGVVLIKVNDEYDTEIKDAYINIQRYYVENNSYNTIEIIKTDYYGQATTKLVLYDIWYKFVIIYNGSTIIETTQLKITSNSMIFKKGAGESVLKDWLDLQNVQYSLTFTNSTRTWVFTFVDTQGLVKEGCLGVIKRTPTENTEICYECQSGTSATITCVLPEGSEGTFVATAWFEINPTYSITQIITLAEKSLGQLFGEDGLIIAMFLVLVCAAVGIWNPVAGITFSLLGLLISFALGFTIMSYAAIISIVIVGVILIIGMNH